MTLDELVHPVTFHQKHFIEFFKLPPFNNEKIVHVCYNINHLQTLLSNQVFRAMLEMAQ